MSDNAFNPLGYNVKGHYRLSMILGLANTLASNSRLFTMRNASSAASPTLLIPTRLTLRTVQDSAGTAQRAVIAAYRATGFTASDNTNSGTPVAMVVSGRGDMAAAPGGAELTNYNGNAAGMTGGTLTKDSSAFMQLPMTVLATANAYIWQAEVMDNAFGNHPIVLARNEGIDVENVFANTTSYGMTFYLDLAWAEVVSFGQ